MAAVSWAQRGPEGCIRLVDAPPEADVEVRPTSPANSGDLPPMAGRLVRDGAMAYFVPRFAFVDGASYTVRIDGAPAGVLHRPRRERPATTEVREILPSAGQVPCNLLRFSIWFSAPMSEGCATSQIRLMGHDGATMDGALLPTEYELWDTDHRRLTVLLDPARLKRGLVAHRDVGYPLRAGATFRLVVHDQFLDATGAPLRAPAERGYHVGSEERRHVEPATWALHVPARHTVEPLGVDFGRPLDHGLLARCLQVSGPGGEPVQGAAQIGPEERSWRFLPSRSWSPGPHTLVIDPVLEDLAGNSVIRVFDRSLERAEDQRRGSPRVTVPFLPRG
jgi:hypothetical protein